MPLIAANASLDGRGRHPPSEPPDLPLSPPSSLAITNTGRFVSKIAEIIETEFGIRALQAALVERRNKIAWVTSFVICPGKVPKVPGRKRGKRGSPAAPRERPREWMILEIRETVTKNHKRAGAGRQIESYGKSKKLSPLGSQKGIRCAHTCSPMILTA